MFDAQRNTTQDSINLATDYRQMLAGCKGQPIELDSILTDARQNLDRGQLRLQDWDSVLDYHNSMAYDGTSVYDTLGN